MQANWVNVGTGYPTVSQLATASGLGSSVFVDGSTSMAYVLVNNVPTILNGAAVFSVADRTTLAGIQNPAASPHRFLRETGREGNFVWSSTNFQTLFGSSLGIIDPGQGIYVPPTSDPTGASGAWVREILAGEVWWNWWGSVSGNAAGAHATTNNAAWTNMASTLNALAFNTSSTLKGSYPVRIGPGFWEHSTKLSLNFGDVSVKGCGGGHGTGQIAHGATILVPIGCTGISNETNRASVSDLCVQGDFTNAEAEFHGIYSKGVIFLDRVFVRGMRGDGFHLTSLDGGSVDMSRISNCEAYFNRYGIALSGSDSNVAQIIGGIYGQNRAFGVAENPTGGLGNAYFSVETNLNGRGSINNGTTIPCTIVNFSGNTYYVKAGREAIASTTAPSAGAADDANYIWAGAGAANPSTGVIAWFSGILLRAGGSYYCSSNVAASTYIGCYHEDGQGPAQLNTRCTVVGGVLSYGFVYMGGSTSPVVMTGSAGVPGMLSVTNGVQAFANTGGWIWKLGDSINRQVLLEFIDSTYLTGTFGCQLMVDTTKGDIIFTTARGTAFPGWRYFGPNSTSLTADGLAHPGAFFVRSLYLPSSNGGAVSTGKPLFRAAAPVVTYTKSYVAPTGGTTIDTQVRASLAQLATDVDKLVVDVADIRTKLQTANHTD